MPGCDKRMFWNIDEYKNEFNNLRLNNSPLLYSYKSRIFLLFEDKKVNKLVRSDLEVDSCFEKEETINYLKYLKEEDFNSV